MNGQCPLRYMIKGIGERCCYRSISYHSQRWKLLIHCPRISGWVNTIWYIHSEEHLSNHTKGMKHGYMLPHRWTQNAKFKKPTHGQELSITGKQWNQNISSCQGVWLGEMGTTASCWLNKELPLGDGKYIQRRVTVMSAHREWSKRCWATVHFKRLKQEMCLCAFYWNLKINCEAGGLPDQGQKRSTLQTL